MSKYKYYSKRYKENSHQKDDFLTNEIFIDGYNISQELLPNIDLLDWIGLCFLERKINNEEKKILSKLFIVSSLKGFKDPSILSALNTSLQQAPTQNIIITHSGISGGLFGGSKEIGLLLSIINKEKNLNNLEKNINSLINKKIDDYGIIKHKLGFMENHKSRSEIINDLLKYFSNFQILKKINEYSKKIDKIEKNMKSPTSINLIIAFILSDLNFNERQGEFFYHFISQPFLSAISIESIKEKRLPFYNDIYGYKNEK